MKIKVSDKLARLGNDILFKTRKASPEIAVILGIAGVVAGTIFAVKAAGKSKEITDEHTETIEELEKRSDEEKETPEYKKEVAKVYVNTGVKLAKIYAPAAACEIGGIALICLSHHVMKDRTAALSAAYSALSAGYRKYQKKVAEKIGEDEEKNLRLGISDKEVEVPFIDDNGEPVTEKETLKVSDEESGCSPYARFFDDYSDEYNPKDREYNLMFLRATEQEATFKLARNGHLFLNEVYDMLGLRRTKDGQVIGWTYNKNKPDNKVSFGIYDVHKPENRAFVNGWEPAILLDFNVDGDILDKI